MQALCGSNVRFEIEDHTLKLEVDLGEPGTPSKSLKNVLVATTHGATEISPGVKLNLNLYRRPSA